VGDTVTTEGTTRGYSLDEFVGDTDDDLLTQALLFAGASTYTPAIVLPGRAMTFRETRTMFDGLRLCGPPGIGNEYRNTQRIRLEVPGSGWLAMPSTGKVKDVCIEGLSFEAGADTCFVRDFPYVSGAPVLWTSVFRDLGFSGFKHIFHGVMTACAFTGWWNVNNGVDSQFKLWGSDLTLWPEGMLLDSPAYPQTGDFSHLWVADLAKSTIGPVFITGKRNVRPMRIDYGRGLVVSAPRLESQQGTPTWGSQLLIRGGKGIRVRDAWFFNGMGQPSGAYNQGVIAITGGTGIVIDGAYFSDGDGRQTSGTVANAPHVHISGGSRIRLRDLQASGALRVARSAGVPAGEVVTDSDVAVAVV
jgi:hypothetical protein